MQEISDTEDTATKARRAGNVSPSRRVGLPGRLGRLSWSQAISCACY